MKQFTVPLSLVLVLGLVGCKDDPNTRIKPVDPNIPYPVPTSKSGPGAAAPKTEKEAPSNKADKKDATDSKDAKDKVEKKDK